MDVLVVCGSPWCKLESLFSAFQAGGVASAEAAEQSFIASIDTWHERLFAGRNGHESSQQLYPGKAWEQAAAGIFLANWDKPLWGWADSRSTWLLDFWQKFDAQIRFVLAYSGPERTLERAIGETVGRLQVRNRVDSRLGSVVPARYAEVRTFGTNDEGSALPAGLVGLKPDLRGPTANDRCSRSPSMPAQWLIAAAPPLNPKPIVEAWLRYNREMLRFFNRNRDRCLLIDVDEGSLDPRGLARVCEDTMGVVFEGELQFPEEAGATERSALSALLARELLRDFPEASELRQEIEATLIRFGGKGRQVGAFAERVPVGEAVGELTGLLYAAGPAMERLREDHHSLRHENAAMADQLDTLRDRVGALERLAEERDRRIESLSRERNEQAGLADSRQEQIGSLEQELGRLRQQTEEKQRAFEEEARQAREAADRQMAQTEQELRSENELLLLQLHQVQEELERYYLQYQAELEKSKQAGELQAQLEAVSKARDEQARLAAERDTQVQALTKARDEQAKLAADRQGQVQKLTQARDEQTKVAAERQTQIEALTKARDEQAKLAADRQGQVQKLTQARDEQTKVAAERQTRIEALTKTRDEQAKLAADRQGQVQKLTQARDEQTKVAAERQTQIEALTKTRDEQAKLAADRQGQMQKLTQARDEQTKVAAERQAQIEALTKARDEQAKLASDRQARIEVLTGDNQKLKQSAADAERQYEAERKQLQESASREQEELRQENELLLLQLHQVQEELERYFLQYQESRNSLKEQESRWNRLLVRHPDYYDWNAIEVVAKDESEVGSMVRWNVKGLIAGNRTVPDFELTTLVRGGHPALVFHRDPEGGSGGPLLRWPLIAQTHEALVLQPRGEESDQNLRWGILSGLTTSDWRLVLAVCSTLVDSLRVSELSLDTRSLPDAAFWVSQLSGLRQQLLQMPVAWRYDGVRLKREQVNPDYEHLWFVLDNAEFGKRRWQTFEFRLSAALVKPEGFSVHPKLEFPHAEDGTKQFENWYAESHDDFGPKFELRFALETQAMDLEVWRALSPYDQAQMTLIVGGIPALLTLLENDGVVISRQWKDWQQLAARTFAAMVRNLQSTPGEEAPTDVAPSSRAPGKKNVRQRKRDVRAENGGKLLR